MSYVELDSGLLAPPSAARLSEVGTRDMMIELLQERLAQLEQSMVWDEPGWEQVGGESQRDFSREGLRRIARQARMMWLANPLIRHAVEVQAHYVMGQGLQVQAKSELVNQAVQAFWDDRGNQRAFTSLEALLGLERLLQITGNLFLVFFPNIANGHVKVRTIPFDEVVEIISDPDDALTPHYYKRIWTERRLDNAGGGIVDVQREAYYPDWEYWPDEKPGAINGKPVHWESPVYHIAAGHLADMRWGVCEFYAALPWARAVTRDLEIYATVKEALSRFAARLVTTGGKAGIAAAKSQLEGRSNTTNRQRTDDTASAGATFIGPKDVDYAPIKTAGSQPSPDEGRRLWLMTAAGVGLPETILSGDADVGNLATAKTLDRPTELKMTARQRFWEVIFQDVLGFVINWSALAPRGILPATHAERTAAGWDVELAPDPDAEANPANPDTFDPLAPIDRHVDVDFPSVLDRSIAERVAAIVSANSTGKLPDELIARELMLALGVDDVDEELARLAQAGSGQPDTTGEQTEEAFVEALRELREALRVIVG